MSICEIAYTVSQETIHGFQQIRCRGANNHHYWRWGQWIRTKPCSKLTRPLRPCLIQTEVTFQLYRTRRGVFADCIIRWLLYDDFLWPHTCMLLSHICGLLLCACMCASEKKMVTYLGKKPTKQERSQVYVAKNRTSIVSQFWNKWPTIPIVCLF